MASYICKLRWLIFILQFILRTKLWEGHLVRCRQTWNWISLVLARHVTLYSTLVGFCEGKPFPPRMWGNVSKPPTLLMKVTCLFQSLISFRRVKRHHEIIPSPGLHCPVMASHSLRWAAFSMHPGLLARKAGPDPLPTDLPTTCLLSCLWKGPTMFLSLSFLADCWRVKTCRSRCQPRRFREGQEMSLARL